MVAAFDYCLHGKGGAAPSIDTAVHGLVDAAHVDHLHPDVGIALAAAADGEALTKACSATGSSRAGPRPQAPRCAGAGQLLPAAAHPRRLPVSRGNAGATPVPAGAGAGGLAALLGRDRRGDGVHRTTTGRARSTGWRPRGSTACSRTPSRSGTCPGGPRTTGPIPGGWRPASNAARSRRVSWLPRSSG